MTFFVTQCSATSFVGLRGRSYSNFLILASEYSGGFLNSRVSVVSSEAIAPVADQFYRVPGVISALT